MDVALLAFISAFGLVLAVELPDKTMVATVVLTTRFRAWSVFVGASAAFAIQAIIATFFGSLLTKLPTNIVLLITALTFGLGAFFLLREGFSRESADTADAWRSGPKTVTFLRSTLTSFGVLFTAEWGDASQLVTVGLTARYGEPLAVGLGAFLGLVSVAGLAVVVGHKLRGRLRPKLIQRLAGFLFACLSLVVVGQAFW